jgi:cytidyltransferase-like protein
VIVAWEGLVPLRGRVAMVDGGFDPLHAGHVDHFEEARTFGVPVLCNVAADDYVSRKHPPLLAQHERVRIIDAIEYVDYVHPSSVTTAAVLRRLAPRFYVKGVDWRERGLPDDELAICAEHGIEVAFLDTVTGSSTAILDQFMERLRASA